VRDVMASLVYIRLIGLTAGTLVQLFWMVVILGYRRQRNFERVFFFLCLALFLFYSGSLLAVNAQIYYGHPPAGLLGFVIAIIIAGLCLFPALLLHLHMEFAETRGLLKDRRWKWAVALLFYAASVHLIFHHVPLQITAANFDFVLPGDSLRQGFAYLYSFSLAWCALWEFRFWRSASIPAERRFHGFLSAVFLLALVGVVSLHLIAALLTATARVILGVTLAFLPIVPLAALIYLVGRHNFLQIGRQKNLVYAVSATFLALLYLSLVRRVSGWLVPMMPPEASAAILLFVLVIFIEPLQRLLGRRLQETAHREMDRVQRLTAEIQQEAKQGDVAGLVRCIERRAREEFELASAKLTLGRKYAERSAALSGTAAPGDGGAQVLEGEPQSPNWFRVGQGEHAAGVLIVQPHGAFLSGETSAALEFFCEQLPNALELCLLIEEKLRLERELAERERLALVGQMAASISHNLKNPLGSIKTILQVQLENPEVPESIRGETRIVLDEVRRLAVKLNQLLQFSRPAVRGGSGEVNCDARVVIEEVVGVLRHEAEARGIDLDWRYKDGNSTVAASAEGLGEIASNLVVNALEACVTGGHVAVNLGWLSGDYLLCVEDDGPGIPPALQEKVLQPFFTTKAKGTGLGLAIVARRVAEFRGSLRFVSPTRDSRGTRCEVRLRSATARQNQVGGSR
jgi:signal transduction histidine kinase